MTDQKFQEEVQTLQEFISCYCHDKHKNTPFETFSFKDHAMELNIHLCKECSALLQYGINRLQECSHENKPRCRKCPEPCYEKQQWKLLAKIMRYSGLKLGFIEIKKRLFKQ